MIRGSSFSASDSKSLSADWLAVFGNELVAGWEFFLIILLSEVLDFWSSSIGLLLICVVWITWGCSLVWSSEPLSGNLLSGNTVTLVCSLQIGIGAPVDGSES